MKPLAPSRPARTGLILGMLLLSGLFTADALAGKPMCGDGKCNGGETPASCSQDCPADSCGDGICGPTESATSCPSDCSVEPPPPGACNNDGVCNAGEDCLGCADCPGKTGGKPKTQFCCGSDTCDTNRCGALCGADVPDCGNFIIEYSEECDDGPAGSASCDIFCNAITPTALVPLNQFNIGDSIGEGEAANGTIGSINHQAVWSTGWDGSDVVNSLNERFEALDAAGYVENNSSRDAVINHALSGAVMDDFAGQAQDVVNSMGSISPGEADMITVLLGNNDVCADTLDDMTLPESFRMQYEAGLEVLANSKIADSVHLMVSGLPSIYWLWYAKRTDFICRAFIWPFVPCQNLLSSAADDCANSATAQDPDTIYTGQGGLVDGPNCQRRKQFHAKIRDVYNPILRDTLADYADRLPNAEYVDIQDVRFDSVHVNGGDCFHPSKAGHALMSSQQWCRSHWGEGDPACSP